MKHLKLYEDYNTENIENTENLEDLVWIFREK